jgi:uncharacterized membrane protein
MTLLHIVAGLIGLASGAVALYALKGVKLHRQSGKIFVYAMLIMSSSGAAMAALKLQRFNVIAGVLTFYLVMTGLLTVRPRVMGFHWIDLGRHAGGAHRGYRQSPLRHRGFAQP